MSLVLLHKLAITTEVGGGGCRYATGHVVAYLHSLRLCLLCWDLMPAYYDHRVFGHISRAARQKPDPTATGVKLINYMYSTPDNCSYVTMNLQHKYIYT